MVEPVRGLTARQAFRLVLVQLAVTLLAAALLVVFSGSGWVLAYSALTGGLIATLANGWFALKVFGRKRAGRNPDPVVLLRSLYWGEINKLIFTGAMFVAAFVLLKPVSGAALIAVYFLVHMTPFVASLFTKDSTTH